MKIVFFDYAAIFVNIILISSLLLQKRTKTKSDIAFIFVILEVFCTTAVGAVTLNLDNIGAGNVIAKKIFHFLYLVFHNFTALFFLYYLMVLTDNWFKVKKYPLKHSIIFIPSLVAVVLLVASLFAPVVFYIDENDVYHRTDAIYILYVAGIINLIFGIYYLFRYKNLFSKKLFFSVFTLFPMIFGAMLFEFLIPHVVIEPFFNTLSLLFISYNIQRPEELIDSKTGLGNTISYTENFKKIFNNKKEIQQVFINVTNYQVISGIIGYDSDFDLAKHITGQITSLNKWLKLQADIYYLKDGKFRVVIEESNFKKVIKFADQINDILKHYVKIGTMNVNPVANVCIVKCPEDINTVDDLIAFGNEMCNAKYYTGRILYAKNLFNSDYFGKLQQIDKVIEKGLAEGNFEVYYQPIYSIKEKRFASAEALLRLYDPDYGAISPEIFIPAAEKSGSIHKIDSFVLEEVCKFISSPEFSKLNVDYIEVNLSVAHCMQDNITEQIFDLLTRYKIDVNKLNLEVTETAVALSEDKFLSNLNKLTKNNIHISLDDFGSGYSNLKRLSQLPLSIVKIDKSITDEIKDERVAIIFTKLCDIIRALNLRVVVEGVETKDVYDYFESCKCDYIQGYYFSKPLPKKEYISFLTNS